MTFPIPTILFGTEPTVDMFGGEAAVDGINALIRDDGNVYAFHRTAAGWAQRQTIGVGAGRGLAISWPFFGVAVAGSNSVDVYMDNAAWVHIARVTAPGPNPHASSSPPFDLRGHMVAIGVPDAPLGPLAPPDPAAAPSTRGAVHAFMKAGPSPHDPYQPWSSMQIQPTPYRRAGATVAIGDVINVIAISDHERVEGVALHRGHDGALMQHLADPNGSDEGTGFGSAIAIDGRWLFIGAPNTAILGTQVGVVHCYELVPSGAVRRQELVDADGTGGFGSHISSRGGVLTVSAGVRALVYELRDGRWQLARDLSEDTPGLGWVPTATDGTSIVGWTGAWARVNDRWQLVNRLLAGTDSAFDRFGDSAGITRVGDSVIAAVGSPGDDSAAPGATMGDNFGSVYLFRRPEAGAWTQTQRVTLPDATYAAGFGHSIALWTDPAGAVQLVVGAPFEGSGFAATGMVGIFTLDPQANATHVTTLHGVAGGSGSDLFGTSLSVIDGTVFVGARGASPSGVRTGAVSVFRRDPAGVWQLLQVLEAPDAAAGAFFGTSLAVAAGSLLIGAPGRTGSAGKQAGAIYVAVRTADDMWQVDGPIAEGSHTWQNLGEDLAGSGDRFAASGPSRKLIPPDPGVVSLFNGAGTAWQQIAEYRGVRPVKGDRFGQRIGLDSDYLYVASATDLALLAYPLASGSSVAPERLLPPVGDRRMGSTIVSLTGLPLLVGAADADTTVGVKSGAVWVYERE